MRRSILLVLCCLMGCVQLMANPVSPISATTQLDMLEATALTLTDGDMSRLLIDGTTLRGTLYLKNHDTVTKKTDITIGITDVETGISRTKPASVTIAPNRTVGYDFSFGNLTAGHHYNVTAAYANGEEFYRSSALFCTNDGIDEDDEGSAGIVSYEYWFDDNYGGHRSVGMDGSSSVIRASIDTRNLSNGVHRFNFRVKRSDGKYSAITSSIFMNLKGETADRLEYWLDNDYQHRVTMPLSATEAEQELTFDLHDSELYPFGFHQLNIRVVKAGFGMSTVYTTGIMKLPLGVATQLEYWFDDDLANSKILEGRLSDSQDSYIYVTDIDVSSLPTGMHRLNYRARNSNGTSYSAVMSEQVLKLPSGVVSLLEYWFDNDQANSKILEGKLSSNQDSYIFVNSIDVSQLSMGMHRLNYRARNSDGTLHSAVQSAQVLKVASGVASQLEFWFDDDMANRKVLSGKLSESKDAYIYINDIDVSQLSIGMHRLNYRACNSEDYVFSAVQSAPIFKVPMGDASILEYWFDDKLSSHKFIAGDAQSDGFLFANDLNLNGVTPGAHRLNVRVRSGDGKRVTAVNSFPVIVKSRFDTDSEVATVDGYSVSVDGGTVHSHSVQHPANEIKQPYVLDTRSLAEGDHTVKMTFWNSFGAGVSEQGTFRVEREQEPIVTLTAQEQDGAVTLQFDAVPNDLRYRIVRVEANGAKAKVDGRNVGIYPATVTYTDNPKEGEYKYYVQTEYKDFSGTIHLITSNEVSISVARAQTEQDAQQMGYIVGRIECDDGYSSGQMRVSFSDGVDVGVSATRFMRKQIPAGTELTLTVTGDEMHEYEPKQITVAAGANEIVLRGILAADYLPSNMANDLCVCAPIELSSEGGQNYLKLDVRNLSQTFTWRGYVRLKAYDSKKAKKKGYDIAALPYETKSLYVGETAVVAIDSEEHKELSIPLGSLGTGDYVVYLESVGQFDATTDGKQTKPVAAGLDAEKECNPLTVAVTKPADITPTWDESHKLQFAYLLVGLSSVAKGLNGKVGDLTPYEQKVVAAARTLTGKYNDKEAVEAMADWMNGREPLDILNDPIITSLTTTVSEIMDLTSKVVVQLPVRYFHDIVEKADKVSKAKMLLDGIIPILKDAALGIKRTDFDRCFTCANLLYAALQLSSDANPYAGLMQGYMVVGKALSNKAMQYMEVVNGRFIATRLKKNRPYNGDGEGRRNSAVDFRIVVKTGRWRWNTVDFTNPDVSRQIKNISIKMALNEGKEPAVFAFNPIFMDNCIMLESDGNGITNDVDIDEFWTPRVFYMEINWANGRQTLVPIDKAYDGVEFDNNGAHINNSIDNFEDEKAPIYTITLTTSTGKYNMADDIYLGTNKKRE